MNTGLRIDVINLVWKHCGGNLTLAEVQVRACQIISIVEAPSENKEEKQASAQPAQP